MKNYAKKIDKVNKKWEALLPKKEKPPAPKSKTAVEIAKEYAAQNIPKPKAKPQEPQNPKWKWGESLGLEEGDQNNLLLPNDTQNVAELEILE